MEILNNLYSSIVNLFESRSFTNGLLLFILIDLTVINSNIAAIYELLRKKITNPS
jgi:hypothetical protein